MTWKISIKGIGGRLRHCYNKIRWSGRPYYADLVEMREQVEALHEDFFPKQNQWPEQRRYGESLAGLPEKQPEG